MCELLALFYALPAHLQASINLPDRPLNLVKAVHATASTFKIHDIELSVKEGIEWYLSRAKTFMKMFEYFFGHVIDWAFVFVKFKKAAKLIGSLFIGVKVHVCLGL